MIDVNASEIANIASNVKVNFKEKKSFLKKKTQLQGIITYDK